MTAAEPPQQPLSPAERWTVAFAALGGAVIPWLGLLKEADPLQFGAWLPLVASALVAWAMGYGAVRAIRSARQRGRAFDDEARRRGWTHVANDQGAALGIVRGCAAFKDSALAPVRLPHVLYGHRDGIPFFVAQVAWHKRRYVNDHVAVGIAMPLRGDLLVERETGEHRLREAFGAGEVDFESDQFSRTFWVRAPDRRFAYAVLHPKAMDFLLRRGPKATWHWNGHWLVVAWTGSFEAREGLRFVREAWDFRALLPRHLLAWERMPDAPDAPAAPFSQAPVAGSAQAGPVPARSR